ncbi:hypothetical protein Ahy_A06g030826 isoform C [Arachis hypogaea]|uniref:factor independent urate hydroxylase n=1 Tax=Arachis hypogaea TaxID=3818 RepID=A0A445CXN3_ARAHY|nr:hypothetical protein Ahy_A06g030826 isoform C [Arachis hypogaea]
MAERVEGFNFEQRHVKKRVRVARVWKTKEGKHYVVEWRVSISLLSDCVNSYLRDDNSDIVATDTMKNTVYAKAKECSELLSVENFAIELAKYFISFYRQVDVNFPVYTNPYLALLWMKSWSLNSRIANGKLIMIK